jgi:hypothetical protein
LSIRLHEALAEKVADLLKRPTAKDAMYLVNEPRTACAVSSVVRGFQ